MANLLNDDFNNIKYKNPELENYLINDNCNMFDYISEFMVKRHTNILDIFNSFMDSKLNNFSSITLSYLNDFKKELFDDIDIYIIFLKIKPVLYKTIKGYHLINDTPIKESVWETILTSAFDFINYKYLYDHGSHQSGKDIVISDNIGISCKSCKETKKHLNISSYRLTTCSKITEFIEQIDNVRVNFKYYSIISRYEINSKIIYNIYLIPSQLIKAGDKKWSIKYKKNSGNTKITEWFTEYKDGIKLSIKSSMSNQLWITIDKEYFSKFCIISNIEINNKKVTNYCELYDKY